MLLVENVSKNFGGVKALNNVSVEIGKREIVGLIGPNGSGKTTLFNVISGILKPDGGKIEFNGVRIDKLPPEKVSRTGISRTFQGMRLLENLSIFDNILIASLSRYKTTKEAEKVVLDAIKFVGLKRYDRAVAELGDLERRLVEVARAVAVEPKLVLFDEIMAGLTESDQNILAKLINRIRNELEISVFWIEHVLRAMFNLVEVDRVVVLNWGNKIAEGAPEEILSNKEVAEAYLGEVSWVR